MQDIEDLLIEVLRNADKIAPQILEEYKKTIDEEDYIANSDSNFYSYLLGGVALGGVSLCALTYSIYSWYVKHYNSNKYEPIFVDKFSDHTDVVLSGTTIESKLLIQDGPPI